MCTVSFFSCFVVCCISPYVSYSSLLSTNPTLQDEEKCCKLCNRKYDTPRILSCLHVFCTGCIANLVEGRASGPKADFDDDDKVMIRAIDMNMTALLQLYTCHYG